MFLDHGCNISVVIEMFCDTGSRDYKDRILMWDFLQVLSCLSVKCHMISEVMMRLRLSLQRAFFSQISHGTKDAQTTLSVDST